MVQGNFVARHTYALHRHGRAVYGRAMEISRDDAERLAKMVEALADRIRTARKLPICDVGECVLNGQKIIVSVNATEPYSSKIFEEYEHTDPRI